MSNINSGVLRPSASLGARLNRQQSRAPNFRGRQSKKKNKKIPKIYKANHPKQYKATYSKNCGRHCLKKDVGCGYAVWVTGLGFSTTVTQARLQMCSLGKNMIRWFCMQPSATLWLRRNATH